ncbi:glutathione S-transferase U19-like [Papaver somniferum]|uniref:glutathione S-transferase U19-like n=1 Tax=Papaver somniferum TaxID=3469 RepID=UPI000E6FF1D7|nr:glutathione S-transferase U19-like [Papaver somniferum]
MKDLKLVSGPNSWETSLIKTTEETKEKKKFNEILDILKTIEEHGLGDKKFFSGDDMGFVDLAFGTFMRWLKVAEEIKEVKKHCRSALHLCTYFSNKEGFQMADAYCSDC